MPKTNALNSKAFQSISLVEALFHCLYTTTTFKRPFRVRYCSKNKLNKTECFQLSVRRFCYRLNGMDQAWPLTQFYVCFLYKIIWRRYFPFTHSRTSFLLVSDSCRFLFSADTTPFMGPQPCMWPPLELSTQKIKLHSVYVFCRKHAFCVKEICNKNRNHYLYLHIDFFQNVGPVHWIV